VKLHVGMFSTVSKPPRPIPLTLLAHDLCRVVANLDIVRFEVFRERWEGWEKGWVKGWVKD